VDDVIGGRVQKGGLAGHRLGVLLPVRPLQVLEGGRVGHGNGDPVEDDDLVAVADVQHHPVVVG